MEKKQPGGAECESARKKKTLQEEAEKYYKITDLFWASSAGQFRLLTLYFLLR